MRIGGIVNESLREIYGQLKPANKEKCTTHIIPEIHNGL